MNYHLIYQKLINKNKNRLLIKENGFEIHHILPKSLGGLDSTDNLVKLTYREHFIAHLLLYKMFPDSFSMLYSAWKFTYSNDGHVKKNNSRTHKILKEAYLKSQIKVLDEIKLREYFLNNKNTINGATKIFECNWLTIQKNMTLFNIEYLWNGIYNKEFTKQEIEFALTEYKFLSAKEIALKLNVKYWVLNEYIKKYNLKHIKPKMNGEKRKALIEYTKGGLNFIDRFKLFKHFGMSQRTVTQTLNEFNINYKSFKEDEEELYNTKLTNFLIEFFNSIPSGYSIIGFNKYFKQDIRTIIKILNKNNIKYDFKYKHHKGKDYVDKVLPFIRRGISCGLLKESTDYFR